MFFKVLPCKVLSNSLNFLYETTATMDKNNNCRYSLILLIALIVALNKVQGAAVGLENDLTKSLDTQDDLNTASAANNGNKMNIAAVQGFNNGFHYLDMFVPVQVPLQQQLWQDDNGIIRLRRSSPYQSQDGFGGVLNMSPPPCPNNYMFTCQPNLASVPCANSNNNNGNNLAMLYQQQQTPQYPPLPAVPQRYQQPNVSKLPAQYPPAGAYSNQVPVYVQPVPMSASVQSHGDQ